MSESSGLDMKTWKRYLKGEYLVVILSTGILFVFYSQIILNPNEHLFSIKGDGLKNYYNYAYHIKYDSTLTSFDGMNFPYGESILYVDCHPLIANLLKLFSENIFNISDYSIAILNILMLLSLIVCAVFLYKILRYFLVDSYLAVIAAIAITFSSSHVLLWQYGHYAISYSCFFPISWYLILLYKKQPNKFTFSLIILIHALFWSYVHNYLGFMIISFTFLFHLFDTLISFKLKSGSDYFNRCIHIGLQCLVPVAILYSGIYLLDSHEGRISMPYSPDYKASFYSVFFPNYSFLKPIYEVFVDLSIQKEQSWSRIGNYIGLSTNMILAVSIVYFFYQLIVKKVNPFKELFSNEVLSGLLGSVVLLLYAMAIPFEDYFQSILNLIPKLKEFVAIGRFAWPFYYVITVFSFLLLSVMLKEKKRILGIFTALLLLVEGLSYHKSLSNIITLNRNILIDDNEVNKAIEGIDPNQFQAVLPLPFYHRYRTPHAFVNSELSEELSMSFSYQSGLPLFGAVLSRPSLIESKQIIQLFLPSFYTKPIKEHLPSTLPVLLVYTHEVLSDSELELVNKATDIYHTKSFTLASLPIDSFFIFNYNKFQKEVSQAQKTFKKDSLLGCYIEDSMSFYYYNSFDDKVSEKSYRGYGALQKQKSKHNLYFDSRPHSFSPGIKYELSFWYYNHLYDQSFNTMWVNVKDSSGKVVEAHYFSPIKVNIYDGDWAFNKVVFEVENKSDYIVLASQGKELYADDIYLDELMIRPQKSNIYQIDTVKNNIYVIKNNEGLLFRK